VRAYRGAADAIRQAGDERVRELAAAGRLKDLAGVGDKTESIVLEVLAGTTPTYLVELEGALPDPEHGPGAAVRAALKGDCHTHSDWSDGGSPIKTMAEAAKALGHEYMVLTDHSPRLTVAKGLSPERLRLQLDVVKQVNEELAPFRILTGIEVDILDDGALDQEEAMLAQLDVVVASVHSKLRMDSDGMTRRMVAALASPHVDILGHCTGRIVVGRGRPESTFDAELVFGACALFDKAVEINCRPERLDPPMWLLERVVAHGCKVSIDTDAHAVGQLEWQAYGCKRAADAGVGIDQIVNTWDVDRLLQWTASHTRAAA
jgi:putative hydrolase